MGGTVGDAGAPAVPVPGVPPLDVSMGGGPAPAAEQAASVNSVALDQMGERTALDAWHRNETRAIEHLPFIYLYNV
jgi:hypothetical protein